ncbi:MAG: phosphate ABC transporter substrate-binding protein [Gammaproteobacteria bacterium]|nr:phosphate ABC transporter substrate-binding protein [Gammaproteobacteria bacterium]
MNKILKKYAVIMALFVAGTASAQAEIAVIVHAGSKVDTLSKSEVSRIFLGKLKRFGDVKAVPVDLRDGSKPRTEFYAQVVGKNAIQLKSYWSTRIFSGKGTPPLELGNSEEVVAWIEKNPGGIGYVDSRAISGDVKTVLTIK